MHWRYWNRWHLLGGGGGYTSSVPKLSFDHWQMYELFLLLCYIYLYVYRIVKVLQHSYSVMKLWKKINESWTSVFGQTKFWPNFALPKKKNLEFCCRIAGICEKPFVIFPKFHEYIYLSPVSTQRFAFILVANVIGEFWKVDNGFSLKYCVLIKIHQIITFISAFLSVQFFFRETEVYFQSTSDILIIPLLFQIRFSGIFFGKLPTPP